MFQYAAARAVAERVDAELVLDRWSGFARDREYRRKYELTPFAIRGRPATWRESWPIWCYRFQEKFFSGKNNGERGLRIERRWYGAFVSDDNQCFYPELFEQAREGAYLMGYYQSPLYFEGMADQIRQELMPPIPTDQRFLELGTRLRSQPTVAVGIRLYEESKDPAAHALGRKEKGMAEIRAALEGLRQRHPGLKVALFCTHRAKCLEELCLPHDTAFVTHEEWFHQSISRLWLLTQCRHHLFNNSSFYWWGAWLSETHHGGAGTGQEIWMSDSFINPAVNSFSWKTF